MRHQRTTSSAWLVMCGALCLSSLSMGCFQTSVGGQTLPSAYFLDDDVQYFPAGPETKLANQIRAIEQYKLEQRAGGSTSDAGSSSGGSSTSNPDTSY